MKFPQNNRWSSRSSSSCVENSKNKRRSVGLGLGRSPVGLGLDAKRRSIGRKNKRRSGGTRGRGVSCCAGTQTGADSNGITRLRVVAWLRGYGSGKARTRSRNRCVGCATILAWLTTFHARAYQRRGASVGSRNAWRGTDRLVSNPPPLEAWLLVFTTAAIYAVDPKGTTRVGVNSLLGYEFPESKTDTIDLKILTTEGERLLRVAGLDSHARRDLFRVLMIIRQLTL